MRVLLSLLCITIIISLLECGLAHPPVTFNAAANSNENPKAGEITKFQFHITDRLNDYARVTFDELVPMHARLLHVMIGSQDMETVYHVHPEDYNDINYMRSLNDTFEIHVNFLRTGLWNIALSFMINYKGNLREGVALFDVVAAGPPPYQSPPSSLDYTLTGTFTTYDLPSDQSYASPIDVKTNVLPNGYIAKLTLPHNARPNNIQYSSCQAFYVEVFKPNGEPAEFVSFLDASLHAIFHGSEDTIYHGHAAFLTDNVNNITKLQRYVNMHSEMMKEGMMNMDMHTPEMVLYMDAVMMGIDMDGTLNCTADMGYTMQTLGMSPEMATFPSNFTLGNKFVGMFDFPNYGDWRAYFMMNVKEGNTTKLIVPTFTLMSKGYYVDGDLCANNNGGCDIIRTCKTNYDTNTVECGPCPAYMEPASDGMCVPLNDDPVINYDDVRPNEPALGVIIGIAIAGSIAIVVVGFVIFLMLDRKKKSGYQAADTDTRNVPLLEAE